MSKGLQPKLHDNARLQEHNLKEAVEIVIEDLSYDYPDIEFHHEKILYKRDIASVLQQYDPDFGSYLANKKSHIRPDGGFIYAQINGKERLICVSEAKKQGKKDSKHGSKGNAIERACKNIKELRNFLFAEKIFPYLLFASGEDFHDGSYILDRITADNYQCPINKLYIHKKLIKIGDRKELHSPASFFIRVETWPIREILNLLYGACEQSLKHYLSKKK